MKFTSIAFITMVGAVAANSIVQEDAAIFADGPVTVSVTCNGNVVWSKLSLLELTTAGKVLVESYNAIHALVNDDDSQLRDLVFGGNIKSGSMLEEGEDNTLDSWFKPRVSKGIWTGTWGCSECPDDDTPDTSGPVLKAWQSKFVAGLLESKVPVFQQIRACTIDLEPGEDTIPEIPNADIDIDCGKHFDLTVLSVSMGAFLSHAIQSSYNKVHADNANDDSELTKVYYYKKNTKKRMLSSSEEEEEGNSLGQQGRFYFGPHNPYKPYHSKGVAAPGLSGWWGCRLCPSDDDVMLSGGAALNSTMAMQRHANQLAAAASGSLLQAWEAELNVALQNGPFEVLKKIEWCDIKLVPHKRFFLEEAVDEEDVVNEVVMVEDTGCGLRGGCKDSDVTME